MEKKEMNRVSERKQKLFDEKMASPLEVGEQISVSQLVFKSYGKDKPVNATILSINGDRIEVREGDNSVNSPKAIITKDQILSRALWKIGANPFSDDDMSVRFVAFTLESILFGLGITNEREKYTNKQGFPIRETNWNPFVIDNDGNKVRYQRGFVWSLEENQLLVESIYQRIECGRILVRKRSWKEIDKMDAEDCAFYDIVDGKQRLNAVAGFIHNEFADLQGNYFNDLSAYAQHQFTNHQLFAYAEMQENTEDSKVIKQFLKLNFAGVPQSKEHIEFVKSINI